MESHALLGRQPGGADSIGVGALRMGFSALPGSRDNLVCQYNAKASALASVQVA